MLSIDSKLWRLRSYTGTFAYITQIASQEIRLVSRGILPSADALAAMTEKEFDKTMREAFHGAD
jgi:hypothetical protein